MVLISTAHGVPRPSKRAGKNQDKIKGISKISVRPLGSMRIHLDCAIGGPFASNVNCCAHSRVLLLVQLALRNVSGTRQREIAAGRASASGGKADESSSILAIRF